MKGFWAAEPAARLMGFGGQLSQVLEGREPLREHREVIGVRCHRSLAGTDSTCQAKMGCEKLCRADAGNAGWGGSIHRIIKLVNPAVLASTQCKDRSGDGSRRCRKSRITIV